LIKSKRNTTATTTTKGGIGWDEWSVGEGVSAGEGEGWRTASWAAHTYNDTRAAESNKQIKCEAEMAKN